MLVLERNEGQSVIVRQEQGKVIGVTKLIRAADKTGSTAIGFKFPATFEVNRDTIDKSKHPGDYDPNGLLRPEAWALQAKQTEPWKVSK